MLARLFLVTLILFCIELGLLIVLLPWSLAWEHNYFLFHFPQLAAFTLDYRVRGAISGLGLVDIGVGFWYVAHFRQTLDRWRGEADDNPPVDVQEPESVSRGKTA